MKTCKDCKQEKADDEYYGINYPRCKKCHSSFVKANQKLKKDYYQNYRSNYRKEHPEKDQAWRNATIKNFEERTGISYNEYQKEQHRKRYNSPEYKKKLNEKRKPKTKEQLEKNRIKQREWYQRNKTYQIAKSMLRYWEKRLKGLE